MAKKKTTPEISPAVEEAFEAPKDTVQVDGETVEVEKNVAKEATSAVQLLLDGKKYELWHEKGEYVIYEKRSPEKVLIQREAEKGKANKLFNKLEAINRTRTREAVLGY